MRLARYPTLFACGVAASIWALSNCRAEAGQPADADIEYRDQSLGLGYHPGNFVGPVAFELVVAPMTHVAFDVQVGYWGLEDGIRGIGCAPQLQWKFLRGWQTPYAGVLYRHEEVWADGQRASSKGGAVTGGWQFQSRNGLGALVGVGVLYKSAVAFSSPRADYYSSGGTFGTYEIAVRYFF